MLVLKFGGTSVASADRLKLVTQIVKDANNVEKSIVVVVSAFSGVTDLLISATNLAEQNDSNYKNVIEEFVDKCHEISRQLLPSQYSNIEQDLKKNHKELRSLLFGVSIIQEASIKTRDIILSFGERNCAFILNKYFLQCGLIGEYIDARKYIKTSKRFGKTRVNFDSTNKLIVEKFANKNQVSVVTGFIGSDLESGRTTTLGRGGSDFSAAIFAAALNAHELQIWTDVSGVLTSDPRKVKKAYTIEQMSYSEAMEMSHFGAKVLYYPTIRPVKELGIPTRIKNTFNPEHNGTLICDKSKSNKSITGLSAINNIAILSIEGSGLQGVSGTANRLFKSLADGKINVIMITQASSEHSISLAIQEDEADRAQVLVSEEFDVEIQRNLVEPIRIDKGLSLLAVVGENMKNSPGLAGKLFSILGKNGINIEAIAQGSSELNITFAIHKNNQLKALNTIHDSFFLSDCKTIHLFIVGVGLIGKTLLRQIEETKELIKRVNGLEVVINGISNSRKMLVSESGIKLNNCIDLLENGDTADINRFISQMKEFNFADSIFVDNTASKIVPQHYLEILKHNIAISTPNKIALSSGIENYRELKRISAKYNTPFLFETNVGAGLPIISTLNNLINSGDEITEIEAVLSGSLSYIFNIFNSSLRFDEVVKTAQNQGYTEPDPREDLSGTDVKRKLLILVREAGFNIESKDVNMTSLLSKEAVEAASVEEFYQVLKLENKTFRNLATESEKNNCKLRFIATYRNGIAVIKLKSIDHTSPFYNLNGSDNMVLFRSRRYKETPLVIRGPGAGADVTAAGVLSEIINIGSTL